MRRKTICHKCGEYGRLEIQRDDIHRINHDTIEHGKKISKRCYLGSLQKAVKNITSVSIVRDDLIDPTLVSELKAAIIEERKEHLKKIHDSDYGTLIARIIQLSHDFGLWKSERHELTKQGTCPHCTQRIQYRFTRIGPNRSLKKNIDSFHIEKGSVLKTSWMDE